MHRGLGDILTPRPQITEPDGWQEVQRGSFGSAIVHRNLDQQIFGRGLGVFHEHVEIPILIEHPGVQQLVLEVVRPAPVVFTNDLAVRVRRLRVLVQVFHVRVGRRRVEVEVALLYVLAVVPFAVGQAEQPLLEDRILAVPERERETEKLVIVGNASQAVLAPAVRSRARLIVAEVIPRVT